MQRRSFLASVVGMLGLPWLRSCKAENQPIAEMALPSWIQDVEPNPFTLPNDWCEPVFRVILKLKNLEHFSSDGMHRAFGLVGRTNSSEIYVASRNLTVPVGRAICRHIHWGPVDENGNREGAVELDVYRFDPWESYEAIGQARLGRGLYPRGDFGPYVNEHATVV